MGEIMSDFIDKWTERRSIFRSNYLIFAIIGLGFVIRVAAIFIFPVSEDTTNVWWMTENIVNNLLAGNGYTIDGINPDLLIFPVYPIFLTALRMLHIPFFCAKIIQCLIGALICLIIYHIGKKIYNKNAGLVASFLWAIYPYSVMHSKALEDSTLLTLFSVLSILLSLMLLENKRFLIAMTLGLVCGLAIMTRNTFLSFMPFLLVWLFVYLGLRYWRHILIFVVVAFLIAVPWVIRNYVYTGYILLSTHGGGGVWIGNNPYINSLLKANLNQDYLMHVDGFISIPPTPEEDRIYYKRAVDFIKSNPAISIENVFLRLYYFYGWNYYFRQTPITNSQNITLSPSNIEELKAEADALYFQPTYRLRSLIYSVSFFPMFLLAVGGIAISSIKSKKNQLLLIFIVSFTAVHLLSIANIRHRQPIDALLTLYAASFILWVISKILLKWQSRNQKNNVPIV
jgi:4-amino-4-deoxy-L-arabinose transferase-like glycosyltransferase